MKKTFLIVALASSLLAGCGVRTSDNVVFDANSVKYFQDERTGFCFSVMVTRKAWSPSTSGVGMSKVPCSDEVMNLIE